MKRCSKQMLMTKELHPVQAHPMEMLWFKHCSIFVCQNTSYSWFEKASFIYSIPEFQEATWFTPPPSCPFPEIPFSCSSATLGLSTSLDIFLVLSLHMLLKMSFPLLKHLSSGIFLMLIKCQLLYKDSPDACHIFLPLDTWHFSLMMKFNPFHHTLRLFYSKRSSFSIDC